MVSGPKVATSETELLAALQQKFSWTGCAGLRPVLSTGITRGESSSAHLASKEMPKGSGLHVCLTQSLISE